jgi:hypothetical protein
MEHRCDAKTQSRSIEKPVGIARSAAKTAQASTSGHLPRALLTNDFDIDTLIQQLPPFGFAILTGSAQLNLWLRQQNGYQPGNEHFKVV